MKNILTIAFLSLSTLAFSQEGIENTEVTPTQAAYEQVGLHAEQIHGLLMNVANLSSDQADEAMMPFLRVIMQARSTSGSEVMGERMATYFQTTFDVSDSQILDLRKVAARYAGAGEGGRTRE